MDLKVYSKNDILNKLAQDGFFVDYLTLDSFLARYRIEAIFEDENGNEFFDKSAYDVLVENVLHRKKEQNAPQVPPEPSAHNFEHSTGVQEESVPETISTPVSHSDSMLEGKVYEEAPVPPSSLQEQQEVLPVKDESKVTQEHFDRPDATFFSENAQPPKGPLENIKWHRWDDVSTELASNESEDRQLIIDNKPEEAAVFAPEQASDIPFIQDSDIPFADTPAADAIETVQSPEPQERIDVQQEPLISSEGRDSAFEGAENKVWSEANPSNHEAAEESKKEISEILSSNDESEEDFDDIGLLSDSIQAQEKFQKYIVNELAKRNIDVTPPKPENAFKFDISQKTLNMIARAIAKKIAKQVSMVLSSDQKNNALLLQTQKKNQALEQKVNTLEEQNKKLKLLLAESNKNLNSYKPTFFGLYRFVRKKTGKRR